jgi:hypothetical protein
MSTRQTHCNRGHELSDGNVYSSPNSPKRRQCRTCLSTRNRKEVPGTQGVRLRARIASRIDEAKFFTFVEKGSGCWLWRGRVDRHGYGRFSGGLAHRIAFQWLSGAIPEGLTLDHLCRTPLCVNPDHLEPVTSAENIRRASLSRTRCKRGHAFTAENTYLQKNTGSRTCRECMRARGRKKVKS